MSAKPAPVSATSNSTCACRYVLPSPGRTVVRAESARSPSQAWHWIRRFPSRARAGTSARQRAEVPARAREGNLLIQCQAWEGDRADSARTTVLPGDGNTYRHAQVEFEVALTGAGFADMCKVNLDCRAEFERRPQARHAFARVILLAVYRHRRARGKLQLDITAVQELCAHPFAIGLEEFAAVDRQRKGQQIAMRLVGATVVGQVRIPEADSKLPQRQQFLRISQRRSSHQTTGRDNQHARAKQPGRVSPSHRSPGWPAELSPACGCATG